MRLFIIFLLLPIGTTVVYGQLPIFKQYDVSDGLASSTVYECRQDSKGFIWIATEAGVSRFDGIKFQNFTTEHGLSDNEVFSTFEDSQGRIWFLTYNGKISYYLKGKIYNSTTNTLLKKLDFTYHITSMYEDTNHNLWFASADEGIKCLNNNNIITTFNDNTKYNNIARFIEKNDTIFALNTQRIVKFYHRKFSAFSQWACSPLLKSGNELGDSLIIESCNNTYKIKKIFTNKTLFELNDSFISIKIDHKRNIWLGLRGKGVIQKRINNFESKKNFLTQTSVAHIFEDNEKNIWFSTLGHGVYFLPKNHFLTIEDPSVNKMGKNYTYSLTSDTSKNLIIGQRNGVVKKLYRRKNHIQVLNNKILSSDNAIREIIVNQQNLIALATEKGLFILDKQGKILHEDQAIGSCKTIIQNKKDNIILVGTNKGLFQVSLQAPYHKKLIVKGRTMALQQDPSGKIWIGTLNGLFCYTNKQLLPYPVARPIQHRITSIHILANGHKLIGTYGYGVILIKNEKDIQYITKKSHGIASNMIRSIYLDHDQEAWLATDKGVSKLMLDTHGEAKEIINFTQNDGLLSNNTRSCYVIQDTVYIATSEGLCFLPYNKKTSTKTPPPIYLTQLMLEGKPLPLSDTLRMNYKDDELNIHFTGISLSSGGDIRFQYKMEGLNDQWHTTTNTFVSYASIPPGTYTFKAFAISKEGISSKKPLTLTIIKRPHFTQTPWFLILINIVLIGIIFSFIAWRIRVRQQAIKIQNRVIDLEQKALRAQMNPHFIFNALSAIQQFINTNEKKEANRYLARFAELMRKVLDNSKKPKVALDDELQALNLYLAFEALRFDHQFDYKIHVDKAVASGMISLPPMIIQPFVENALLHGIAPLIAKNKKGLLKISLHLKGENLHCIITDNGVGRKEAAQIKEKRLIKHDSTAIKNVKERLKILNKHKKKYIESLKIIDLYNEKQHAIGTRVEIIIPINN